MPLWLTGIWGKIALAGAGILALLIAVLRIFTKGEQAGAAKVEAKQARAVTKAQEQANVVEQKVNAAPEGEAARELEDKWTRN